MTTEEKIEEIGTHKPINFISESDLCAYQQGLERGAREMAEWIESQLLKDNIEDELERFAYSLPHSADGFWPKNIDPKSMEARTKYGVHHYWSYEQVMNIARHFAEWQREQLMNELWHKGTDNPGNKHPYPVINPDTQEMAFAYYDQRFGLWEFDRDYNPGRNMLWLDIEKILPDLQEGGEK